MSEPVIVTGYWHVREDRLESTYLDKFKDVLKLNHKMVIFIPKKYEKYVLDYRKNFKEKTHVVITELDDIKNLYFKEYWNQLHSIRTNPTWYNSTNWLIKNPQYFSEWYNPIVMSKVFFVKHAHELNIFNNEAYIWVDAGITQHINSNLITDIALNNMANIIENVLFTSIDYTGNEIHGFDYSGYKKYTDIIPNWLCRATIFGCNSKFICKFNEDYKYYLMDTLNRGFLGTEESILTLLSCVHPDTYKRYHAHRTGMPDLFLNTMNTM